MEAKQLIDRAPKLIREAFREAWAEIAGNFGDDPDTVERARLKLVNIMLALHPDKTMTVIQLKTASLETMALLYRDEAPSRQPISRPQNAATSMPWASPRRDLAH